MTVNSGSIQHGRQNSVLVILDFGIDMVYKGY